MVLGFNNASKYSKFCLASSSAYDLREDLSSNSYVQLISSISTIIHTTRSSCLKLWTAASKYNVFP